MQTRFKDEASQAGRGESTETQLKVTLESNDVTDSTVINDPFADKNIIKETLDNTNHLKASSSLIMSSLLVGLPDSEDDYLESKNIYAKTNPASFSPTKKNILKPITHHPLENIGEQTQTDLKKTPLELTKMNLNEQISNLCERTTSSSYLPKFLKRLPSNISIPPISSDMLEDTKDDKDPHLFRKKIQHGIFSFFTIMPTDTWKGKASNILLWTMQTGASLWNAKNAYEGLYKWYSDSSIEQDYTSDISVKVICVAASIFLFWLTQKGIGTGIHHYKLFKNVIDNLRNAVNDIVSYLEKINKSQDVQTKEIELLRKKIFLSDELIKVIIDPVIIEERCDDTKKRRIATLLQELQNTYVAENDLESSSHQRKMRVS